MIESLSAQRSSWTRADVLQAICDQHTARVPNIRDAGGQPASNAQPIRWSGGSSISTRPARRRVRGSDGRSVWIEPTAPRFTSEAVLAQEEAIVVWAMAAQADPPTPSVDTVDRDGLDVLQADAAARSPARTGWCWSSVRPGAGKTRMLAAAADDLHAARSGRVRGGADCEGRTHDRA